MVWKRFVSGRAEANMENWQMVGLRSTYIVDLLFNKSAFSLCEGRFRSWLRTKWRASSTGKYSLFIWGSNCLADAWCTLSRDGLKRRPLYLVLKKFSKHIWALMFGRKNIPIWAPCQHCWACDYDSRQSPQSFHKFPCPVEDSGLGVTYCPRSQLHARFAKAAGHKHICSSSSSYLKN